MLVMMTNHSNCQLEWFSYLVATDMVDILLHMAGIATQEVDINSYDTIDTVLVTVNSTGDAARIDAYQIFHVRWRDDVTE